MENNVWIEDTKKGVWEKYIRNKGITMCCIYIFAIFCVFMQFMHFYITHDHVPGGNVPMTMSMVDIMGALSSGRFVNILIVAIYWLLDKIRVGHYSNLYVIQFLGIILYGISAAILYTIVETYFQSIYSKIVGFVCILIAYTNPLMTETYTYGAFDWGIAVLLSIIAAIMLARRKWLLGFIFSFLTVSTYQADILIVVIVAFLLTFLLYYDDSVRIKLTGYIYITVLSGSATIINLLLQRVGVAVNGGQTAKTVSFMEGLVDKIQTIRYIAWYCVWVETYNMFPKWGLFIYFCTIFLVGLFILAFNKSRLIIWFEWIICSLLVFVGPFLFGLAMAIPGYPQRTMLSLFFGIAMYSVACMFLTKNMKNIQKVVSGVICIFALTTVFMTETTILDCYIVRAIDENEIECIYSELREYEIETGNAIKEIAYKAQSNERLVYDEQFIQFNYYTYAMRMVAKNWSRVSYINYLKGSDYKSREMTDDEYESFFSGEGLSVYNPSLQLAFEDHTMYWLIY